MKIEIEIEIDSKKQYNWYNWIYYYVDAAVAYFTLTKLPKRLVFVTKVALGLGLRL